jgi:hypothetical protein
MKCTFLVPIAVLVFAYGAAAELPAPAFNGVWSASRCSTTPKGLHSERRNTLTIDSHGRTTEVYDITLSLRTPHPPAPLHLIQSRYATQVTESGSSISIQWSPLKLVSPRPQDIPPGLLLWTGPTTTRYSLQGSKLATVEEKSLVYTRVKPLLR